MTTLARRSIAVAALLAVIASNAFAQQPTQSNREFLQVKEQRLSNYTKDFLSAIL